MKFKKSLLEKIVKEELQNVLIEYMGEAEDEEDEEKGPPETSTGEEDNAPDGKEEPDNMAPSKGASAEDEEPDEEPPGEAPIGGDVADDEMEKDVSEPEEEEEPDEDPEEEDPEKASVGSELEGKTIKSIKFDEESPISKGLQSITISFDEDTHPLVIVLGKGARVQYLYKGAVHSEL